MKPDLFEAFDREMAIFKAQIEKMTREWEELERKLETSRQVRGYGK